MKKGEFSETLMAKMSQEPQPHLGGMFGKEDFGHLTHIEDPMEEDINVPQERKAQKNPISMNNLASMILLICFMS